MKLSFDANAVSREIFDDMVSGRITRREAYDRYNELYRNLDTKQLMSVNGRLSRMHGSLERTLGRYALTIYDNTRREQELMRLYADKFGVRYRDNGTDNSGRLLIGRENLRDSPDFIATEKELTYPVEVKFVKSLTKYTVSAYQLASYIKHDSRVLIFFTDGIQVGPCGDPDLPADYDIDPSILWFALVSCERMAELKTLDSKFHQEQPGTDSYQLTGRKRISEFFGVAKFE